MPKKLKYLQEGVQGGGVCRGVHGRGVQGGGVQGVHGGGGAGRRRRGCREGAIFREEEKIVETQSNIQYKLQ